MGSIASDQGGQYFSMSGGQCYSISVVQYVSKCEKHALSGDEGGRGGVRRQTSNVRLETGGT